MSLLSPPKQVSSIEAKVVILGSQGVGKTSLVLRHVGNTFSRNVSPTIGASFFNYSMTVNYYRIKLQLWDTAGQERFRSMAPMYYRRANAALIVFDITREKTFNEAKDWVRELESKMDSKLALCVVGNKTDLSDRRQVSRERGEEFAHQIGAMYTETSAADNTGVREAFLKVAQGVISLFQQNQLKASGVDPSYSPLNSYTLRVDHSQMQSNGHKVAVTEESAKPSLEESSLFHRCCGS